MSNSSLVNKELVKNYINRKYDRILESILRAEEESLSRSPSIYVSSKTSAGVSGSNSSGSGSNACTGISSGSTAPYDPSSSLLVSSSSLSPLSSDAPDAPPRISNRRLLRKVAGSLVLASIEKLRQPRTSIDQVGTVTVTASNPKVTDVPNTDTLAGDSTTHTHTNEDTLREFVPKRSYFLDIFLDKLTESVLPENLPERATLNPDAQTTKFSLSTLTTNFQRLGENLHSVFDLQDTVIKLITWRQPARTLSNLMILTLLFHRPLYFALLPLFCLMYVVIVPRYTSLHPFEGREALVELNFKGTCRHKDGRSLLLDVLSVSVNTNTDTNTGDKVDTGASVGVVANLRDLQSFTTSLIKVIDSWAAMVDETVMFNDEWLTTVIFLGSLVLFLVLNFFGGLINWSLLSSAMVWFAVILFHPRIYPYTIGYYLRWKEDNKERLSESMLPQQRGVKPKFKSLFKRVIEIVADEKPQTRDVEIFEIDKEGVVPGTWELFMFSSTDFGLNDTFRKAQRQPPGVDSLGAVMAPKGWIFDPNSKWEIDRDVKSWWKSDLEGYVTNGEYLVDHVFRRRRLTRRVIRVGRREREGEGT